VGEKTVMLRPARADDAEALATAHVRAWQVGYRGILPQDYLDAIDLDARAEQWRGWVEHGRFRRTHVVVAEVDGAVVGFAIHGPEGGATDASDANDANDATNATGEDGDPPSGTVGELYSLNVHPTHWGAGTGSALMSYVVAALARAGHTEAVLWVLPRNARARRFYERKGWATDGAERTDTVQGVTVDEIRYRRRLP
jgi:GNAT superfamily N-acetyltransferase